MKNLKIKDGFRGEKAYVLPPSCLEELKTSPLSSILHITDIGYYPEAANHFRIRKEPLSQYVFIYCIKGSGWYEVGGKRYNVGADSYFILPPGLPHSYGSNHNNPWTIYWIHFNGTLAPEYMPHLSGPIEIKPSARSRIAHRLEIFDEIMDTLDSGFSKENLLYACSVFHHFLGSLRFLNQYRTIDTDKDFDMVEMAIHFMKENISKKIRLSEIADFTGYSQTQFSSCFSSCKGIPPMEYLNQLRIKQACRFLDFSTLKINQICHRVGISDPYYFSRLFKRIMGVSPLAYRNNNKG